MLWCACVGSSMEREGKGDHTDTTEHSCNDRRRLCNKRFTAKKYLSRRRTLHARENWYSCSECQGRFLSLNALRYHRNTHRGIYKCTECGKRCGTSAHLREHRRIHSGEKPFACTVCGKLFTTSGSLVIHSRIHSGEKPFACTVCGKRFTNSGSLVKHSRVHSGEKPFACTVCGKRFTNSGNLDKHSRVHSGEKPFECTVCGKRFAQSGNLVEHNKVHSGEKPCKCTVCGKRFTQPASLVRHSRVHSGEKPFEYASDNEGTWFTCDICQKKFSHKDDIRSHVLRHEGVKVCASSKGPAATLKAHQNVHSDFKQFCCGKCGRYFKYKDTVVCHFERCSDDRLGIISLFNPHISEWPLSRARTTVLMAIIQATVRKWILTSTKLISVICLHTLRVDYK